MNLVYECVVRTKEVNFHPSSGPVVHSSHFKFGWTPGAVRRGLDPTTPFPLYPLRSSKPNGDG